MQIRTYTYTHIAPQQHAHRALTTHHLTQAGADLPACAFVRTHSAMRTCVRMLRGVYRHTHAWGRPALCYNGGLHPPVGVGRDGGNNPMLCYAYAMLCYVMLCYAMLCDYFKEAGARPCHRGRPVHVDPPGGRSMIRCQPTCSFVVSLHRMRQIDQHELSLHAHMLTQCRHNVDSPGGISADFATR